MADIKFQTDPATNPPANESQAIDLSSNNTRITFSQAILLLSLASIEFAIIAGFIIYRYDKAVQSMNMLPISNIRNK